MTPYFIFSPPIVFFILSQRMCLFYLLLIEFSISTCCSVTQSCSTFCDPMDCSMPGFPRSLLKLVSIELLMLSNHFYYSIIISQELIFFFNQYSCHIHGSNILLSLRLLEQCFEMFSLNSLFANFFFCSIIPNVLSSNTWQYFAIFSYV